MSFYADKMGKERYRGIEAIKKKVMIMIKEEVMIMIKKEVMIMI